MVVMTAPVKVGVVVARACSSFRSGSKGNGNGANQSADNSVKRFQNKE